MGSDAIRWHVHCSVCGAFIEKSAHCDSEVECKKCRSTLEILVKDDIVSLNVFLLAREMQLADVLYDDLFNNLPKEKQSELTGRKDYFAKKAGITL